MVSQVSQVKPHVFQDGADLAVSFQNCERALKRVFPTTRWERENPMEVQGNHLFFYLVPSGIIVYIIWYHSVYIIKLIDL